MSVVVYWAQKGCETMDITRTYTVKKGYDVIVCGGGPAGVAAAVSAGRKGAKTLLIERGGCLGGFWTRGGLTWLVDTENKDGLINEVMDRLQDFADGKRIPSPKRFTADTEKTKLFFELLCREAGVQVLYHTMVCDAKTEKGAISHVLTESKDGPVAYGAKYFVDTTGDGDLGCFAGAEFSLGNAEGSTQPMSLICQLDGIHLQDMTPFDSRKSKGTKPALNAQFQKAGLTPSYGAPLLAVLSDAHGTVGLMANHEYSSGLDTAAVSDATMSGRQELHRLVDGLRSLGGIWENVHICATSDAIGVREGRRIKGLYTLTAEDVSAGRQFADGICTVLGGTDIHGLKPGAAFEKSEKHSGYQIPLRCLVSADISNLLMGGRCISGDFVAHGSYRVGGPAFRTGEVAGLLAAHCALSGICPGAVADPSILV